MEMSSDSLNHDSYYVGWICALPKEQTAATAMLDKRHGDLPKPASDPNTYTLGSIGKHNIVIACLPKGKIGTVSAATVATRLVATFPSIKFGLMVGIGGGIPPKVRLGDVVVSTPIGSFPGVVQWDFGKAKEGGHYGPGWQPSGYPHVDGNPQDHANDDDEDFEEQSCQLCDKTRVIKRRKRDFRVHHGLVASGNQVIKDALFRDRLNKDLGGQVLCVEMEAAGLSQDFPSLIIRGICDYADSHKNKEWQEQAAAAAAAFAKELLAYVQPSDVDGEQTVVDMLRQVHQTTSATHQHVNRLESRMTKDGDMRIIDSLNAIDYTTQQKNSFARRQPGTGQWFLESPQYRNWLEIEQQTLFCPGIPGAGKTILTSIIIDDLISRFGGEQDVGIAYIYCSFQRHSTQSVDDMVKSLLKQLAQGLTPLPDYVKDVCPYGSKICSTTPRAFSDVLQGVAETYSRVFILIDGLDECGNTDNNRTKLLAQLSEVQALSGLNILATSRTVPQIVEEVSEQFRNVTTLQIHAHDQDIRSYLVGAMSRLPKFVNRDPDLQKEITTKIIEVVDGMFLLAQLHFESLRGKVSVKSIRIALENIKTGSRSYDHAYNITMQRIKEQFPDEAELAMNVLMWLTHAMKPLWVEELQIALAVEVASEGFDKDNIPDAEQLISVCAGLVTTDEYGRGIRLVHYTTQEYFERTGESWFPTAHEDMMKTCTTYLSYKDFVELREVRLFSDEYYGFVQENRLLIYAWSKWAEHARNVPHLSSEVMDFLECGASVRFAGKELDQTASVVKYHDRYHRPSTEGITGLHLAAWFGLEREVEVLLQRGADIDAQTCFGESSLWFAIEKHHRTVVVQLLEKGASYKTNCNGRTPLLHAISEGFEDIVEILIDNEAHLYECSWEDFDDYTRCPIYFSYLLAAIDQGKAIIVKMLLESGADPNFGTFRDLTPLALAAEKGHETIVKLLLDSGADVDGPSKWGYPPLMCVHKTRGEAVFKLLLENGANTEARDKRGYTPLLHYAESMNINEFQVKMLLEHNADIKAESKNGETPPVLATRAALNNHSLAPKVRALLEHGADVEAQDEYCHTPLVLSCQKPDETITELLLEYGANTEARDPHGETPLSRATRMLCLSTAWFLEDYYKCLIDLSWNLTNRSTIVPNMKESEFMVAIIVPIDTPTTKNNQVSIRSYLSVVMDGRVDPILMALLECSTKLEFKLEPGASTSSDLFSESDSTVVKLESAAILVKNGRRIWKNGGGAFYGIPNDRRSQLLQNFKTVNLLLKNGAKMSGETYQAYYPVNPAKSVQKQAIADLLLEYGVKNFSQTDLIDCT